MEQSEKRKTGSSLILCLNMIFVLDRGLKVTGLGVFYLSISHQIIKKIIKEAVGKADFWGWFGTQVARALARRHTEWDPTVLVSSPGFGP